MNSKNYPSYLRHTWRYFILLIVLIFQAFAPDLNTFPKENILFPIFFYKLLNAFSFPLILILSGTIVCDYYHSLTLEKNQG